MKRQCSTCAKRFTCPFFQKGLEEWVCLSYEEDEYIKKKERKNEPTIMDLQRLHQY